MIAGFVGRMGSGKTLSMTRELYKYFQRGFKIYTNYHVSFEHEVINFDELFEMAMSQTALENVVVALDEVHIMLDSRAGMSDVNRVMTFWLNQTRKQGVKLFYTTQYTHQIDKRLRSGTDIWIFCDGMKITKTGTDYFVCYNDVSDGATTKREIFLGNDIYSLYNTNEVIKFVNRKELRKKHSEKQKEEMTA